MTPAEKQKLWVEIVEAGQNVGLPAKYLGNYCKAERDGSCNWVHCPQELAGEPDKTGRHCPLDIHEEERGYQ